MVVADVVEEEEGVFRSRLSRVCERLVTLLVVSFVFLLSLVMVVYVCLVVGKNKAEVWVYKEFCLCRVVCYFRVYGFF